MSPSTMFDFPESGEPLKDSLAPGAVILRRLALSEESALLEALHKVIAQSPFRHMITPGGHQMLFSVFWGSTSS